MSGRAWPSSPEIVSQPLGVHALQLLPGRRSLSDFRDGEDAVLEEAAHSSPGAVPAEPVAAGAGRQAVVGSSSAALVPLYDVIDLPVAGQLGGPAMFLEFNRVATEVAVAGRLIEDGA